MRRKITFSSVFCHSINVFIASVFILVEKDNRLGEGNHKTIVFLGHSPIHRTTPTHPKGLERKQIRKFYIF